MKPGDKVTYVPIHAQDDPYKWEHGIVKALSDFPDKVFVVFHCAGDWEAYWRYTAVLTSLYMLYEGWLDLEAYELLIPKGPEI